MGHSGMGHLLAAKQERAEAGFDGLVNEFTWALNAGPQTEICTPGFGTKAMPVADVIVDHFAGEAGDADLNELLTILALAAKQSDNTGMRASALIHKMARHHAAFHVGDL